MPGGMVEELDGIPIANQCVGSRIALKNTLPHLHTCDQIASTAVCHSVNHEGGVETLRLVFDAHREEYIVESTNIRHITGSPDVTSDDPAITESTLRVAVRLIVDQTFSPRESDLASWLKRR
ncbi:hypothetical protein BR93DRAFT_924990 [Coniochaeta sp. PMI_546]|nr:hypothetical protein BR93DRAFT_924990 [Coniochaeta sp. PMI_546]